MAGLAACGGDAGDAGSEANADAVARLGIDTQTAERLAVETIASGRAWSPVAAVGAAFKTLDHDDRATVVRDVGGWLRAFVESDAFDSAYAAYRRSRAPAAASYDESVDEAVERWQREGLAQLEETRKNVLPLIPEADRAGMLESLETMEAQFRDPGMMAIQRQAAEMQRVQDQQSYESSLADWRERYPEDPDDLVRQRLETFLATCADVDFDADLTEQHGRLKFVDERYERKSTPARTAWRRRARSRRTGWGRVDT